ncbi:MAG: DUF4442 domain-containing protein [Cytophagales bacterium]|nr:MAG: DUF4442 domain-containing protein [Cytophagales bacterium]
MEFQNQMTKGLQQLEALPTEQRSKMLNAFLSNQVKFLATTDTLIEKMSPNETIVTIANQTKVQNHIGTVHAAAMILVAETATGMVVGMNMPDDKVQVAKSVNTKFIKIAKGGLKAIATLTDEQRRLIQTTEKGEVQVAVKVTDETGNEPIISEITWAWFPKEKKAEVSPTQFLKEQIYQALQKLKADAKPAWGSFTAQEMIEHLVEVVNKSYLMEYDKDRTPKPEQLQYKKFILEDKNPYPKNMKNPFFKEGTPPLQYKDLDEAKAELKKALERFFVHFEKPENKEKLYFHIAFGGVNFDEMQQFHAAHTQHHFQQFELL